MQLDFRDSGLDLSPNRTRHAVKVLGFSDLREALLMVDNAEVLELRTCVVWRMKGAIYKLS